MTVVKVNFKDFRISRLFLNAHTIANINGTIKMKMESIPQTQSKSTR